MNNQYFILGCFNYDDNRPNTEIIFSDKRLEVVKECLGLIDKFNTLNKEEKEEEAEKIREKLEDDFGVNTQDLDVADVHARVYHSAVLKSD